MKITDADIVRHLIMDGKIKRHYWQNTYVTTNQVGCLVQAFTNSTAPFELTVSALAATDWEIIA